MGNIALVVNPSAGKGRTIRRLPFIKKRLSELTIEDYISKNEEDLRNWVSENIYNYETLVGVGGDSTLNMIANEIIKRKVQTKLGMTALGSSNDIAKAFGINSLEDACYALEQGETKKIDIGAIVDENSNETYFLGNASIGLGVTVNKYVKEHPFLARSQFIVGLAGVVNSYRTNKVPIDIIIEHEKGKIQKNPVFVVFSNTKYYATGRMPNPYASPNDGKLDCCIITTDSLYKFICIILSSSKGKHIRKKEEVKLLKSEYFRITSNKKFGIQVDGETIGSYNKLTLRIIPKTLDVVVHPNYK